MTSVDKIGTRCRKSLVPDLYKTGCDLFLKEKAFIVPVLIHFRWGSAVLWANDVADGLQEAYFVTDKFQNEYTDRETACFAARKWGHSSVQQQNCN